MGRLIFRVHALQRMFERQISVDDVTSVLIRGKKIAEYPDDLPYPSYLMLGWREDRPLHVVFADNKEGNETVIITVYEPDNDLWEPEFERRREL